MTFSYGSAQYDRTESSVELFDRADRIMYERKKALHARERKEEMPQDNVPEPVRSADSQM